MPIAVGPSLVRVVSCVVLASACLLGGSSPTRAEGPAAQHDASPATANEAKRSIAETYAGEYSLVAGKKSRDAAIEDVIAEMNVLLRPIARQKLRDGNPMAKKLSITVEGDSIVVAFDGKRDAAKIDGTKTKIVGIQGDSLDYHVRVGESRLRQVYSGVRGGRSNNIRLRKGDKLSIAVEMTSDRLPKPLRYRLSYRLR